MKNKNFLFIAVMLFSISFFGQNTKEKNNFIFIETASLTKTNQLVENFLTQDTRLRVTRDAKKLIKSRNYTNINRKQDVTEVPNINGKMNVNTKIYLDGSMILGFGVNRLYLLEQKKVRDFESFASDYSKQSIYLVSKK